MPLTSDQKTKVKQALVNYSRDVRSVVKKHKQRIISLVEETDNQKVSHLRRAIQEK